MSLPGCSPLTTHPSNPESQQLSHVSPRLLQGASWSYHQLTTRRKLWKDFKKKKADQSPSVTWRQIAFKILSLSHQVWRRCMQKKQRPVASEAHWRCGGDCNPLGSWCTSHSLWALLIELALRRSEQTARSLLVLRERNRSFNAFWQSQQSFSCFQCMIREDLLQRSPQIPVNVYLH